MNSVPSELRDSLSVGVEGGSNFTFLGDGIVKQLLEVDGVGEVITRVVQDKKGLSSTGSGEVTTRGEWCCSFWL